MAEGVSRQAESDGSTAGQPAPLGLAGQPVVKGRGADKDAALFTTATYASQGLLFIAGLVQKGLLGPVGSGFWALMQSFWAFFPILTLGAAAGGSRQIPLHRGRGDYLAAARAAATGASFSILAVGVGGLLIAAFALLAGSAWEPEVRYGLVVLGLIAPLRMLSDAHELILGATRRFQALARGTVLKGIVALTVQTLAVVLFGFWGMFIGVVATAAALLALWAHLGLSGRRNPAFAGGIDRSALRDLIGYGAPLIVWGQLWILFTSIDNLLVAGLIDVRNLGYYALAVSVTTYLLHMPRSVGAVLAPRMSEEYGRTGDVASLQGYAINAQRLLAQMLIPLFLAATFFLLPVLIRHALPEFRPSIDVVQVMVAGSFFMALTNMPVKTMITIGRRLPLILLLLPCLALNVGGNYLAIEVLDTGIEGAAVATSASYFAVFLLTSGFGLTQVIGGRRTAVHVAELILIAAYTIAVVWAIEALIGPGNGSLIPDVAVGLGKLALALLALAPLLWRSQRQDRGPERMLGLIGSGAALVRRRIKRSSG